VFLTDGPQLIAGSLQGTDQDCPESGQPRHQKLRGHPVGFTGFGSGQRAKVEVAGKERAFPKPTVHIHHCCRTRLNRRLDGTLLNKGSVN